MKPKAKIKTKTNKTTHEKISIAFWKFSSTLSDTLNNLAIFLFQNKKMNNALIGLGQKEHSQMNNNKNGKLF